MEFQSFKIIQDFKKDHMWCFFFRLVYDQLRSIPVSIILYLMAFKQWPKSNFLN